MTTWCSLDQPLLSNIIRHEWSGLCGKPSLFAPVRYSFYSWLRWRYLPPFYHMVRCWQRVLQSYTTVVCSEDIQAFFYAPRFTSVLLFSWSKLLVWPPVMFSLSPFVNLILALLCTVSFVTVCLWGNFQRVGWWWVFYPAVLDDDDSVHKTYGIVKY